MMEKGGVRFVTVWNADAAYYHAARRNLQQAHDREPVIKEKNRNLQDLKPEAEKIIQKYGGDKVRAMHEAGKIWVEMSFREDELKREYGPSLTHLAAVHIFCAASLEAHINAAAAVALSGPDNKEFRRKFKRKKSLRAKWLSLPKFLGKAGFQPDNHPFREFANLVRYRKNLVHSRPWKEEWIDFGLPSLSEKLGLTLAEAQRSVETVQSMILTLSIQLGKDVPMWINVDSGNYFGFDVVKRDLRRRP